MKLTLPGNVNVILEVMAASCECLGSECWHLMTFLYTFFPSAKQDAVEGIDTVGVDSDSQEAGVDSVSLLSEGASESTRRGNRRQGSLDESKDDEVCSPSVSIESQTPTGSPERSESPERIRGVENRGERMMGRGSCGFSSTNFVPAPMLPVT